MRTDSRCPDGNFARASGLLALCVAAICDNILANKFDSSASRCHITTMDCAHSTRNVDLGTIRTMSSNDADAAACTCFAISTHNLDSTARADTARSNVQRCGAA